MPRLILSANAVPGRGGQGLNLRHMMEALRRDFRLEIYCRAGEDCGTAMRPVRASRRAEWIGRIPLLRRRRDWQTWHADVSFDRQVAAALSEADVFQGVTGQCRDSLQAARRRGCRTVLDSVTAHIGAFGAQLDRECGRFGVRPPVGERLRRRMLDEYRHADAIRVMSHVARRTFLEHGVPDDKVFVATPPFPVAEFPTATFDAGVFRVCFVGLIEPWKGFHYLIEAFQAAAIQDSELVLWGGPGARPISDYLRTRTECDPRIHVRPVEVRQAGLAQVYGAASVLVQPSLSDGFGYVVGEAMASGLPAIVTSATGAADLIEDGVNGYIVPPGDRGAIAERLRHLAVNPGLLRQMGAAARQTMAALTPAAFRESLLTPIDALLNDRIKPCLI